MEINKNLRLILRDLHLYDIEACHYTIMKSLGYDLEGVDPNDKLARNIKIGQMMRDNPRITSLLRTTTESVINDYILKNKVKDDEIVLRQYDGIILTRTLSCTSISHIPLNRRKTFQKFIASIDRRKYIAMDNNFKISIKGMSHRYPQMDKMYKRLCSIADMKKGSMFLNLQKLKDEIIETDDCKLFGIPQKNGKMIVFLQGYGEIEISEPTLRIMDTQDVDRERYFKYYIEPFTKSIVFENVR